MTVPSLASHRLHTDAVVAALRDAGLTVFDAGPPLSSDEGWGWKGAPGQSDFAPYTIVYPLEGGIYGGTLGDPDDDASLIWQVTCVGGTRQQCEWVVDQTMRALVGPTLEVEGRWVSRVWADMAGGGVRRDDTVQPPVFISTPRFRVESSPL